jgi:hypothetical protein
VDLFPQLWIVFSFSLSFVMHALFWIFGTILLLNNGDVLCCLMLLYWTGLIMLEFAAPLIHYGPKLCSYGHILMHSTMCWTLMSGDGFFIFNVWCMLVLFPGESFSPGYLMENPNRINNRSWHILCWNVRGINSTIKWVVIRSKIQEANFDIICLQETKHEIFEQSYLRNFCPPQYNRFEFNPSVGASGGTIII